MIKPRMARSLVINMPRWLGTQFVQHQHHKRRRTHMEKPKEDHTRTFRRNSVHTIYIQTYMHIRTRAHTHARTHARTHYYLLYSRHMQSTQRMQHAKYVWVSASYVCMYMHVGDCIQHLPAGSCKCWTVQLSRSSSLPKPAALTPSDTITGSNDQGLR